MAKGNWKKIESAPRDGTHFDVFMTVWASPRSMGMADAFMIPDCWFDTTGKLVHIYRGEPTELAERYAQHWAASGKKHKTGPAGETMDYWRG